MSSDKITYKAIIDRVREKLCCESDRISDSPSALRCSWWPNVPDFHDELLSDYNMSGMFGALEKEFREEIMAIRETLDELDHEAGLEDWQNSSQLMMSLNQMATAMSVWDQIGISIRRRGDLVFRIWSPRDVMGSPIIKALPLDLFLNGVAHQTASWHIEIEHLKKVMGYWRLVVIFLGAIVGLGILAWVS